jgi:Flp pilus assembly protein TadD
MTSRHAQRWAILIVALLALVVIGLAALPAQRPVFPTSTPEIYNIDDAIVSARGSGRVMQAIYLADAQLRRSGPNVARLRQLGDLWQQAGDVTRALPYWAAASDAAPRDATIARALATAYVGLSRWSEAVAALNRLLQLAPDDRWAYLQLGLIQAPLDPKAAEKNLRAANLEPAYRATTLALLRTLDQYSSDPLVSMRVGLTLVDLAEWPYAELAFRHAATVAAPFPQALAYESLARDSQGKDGADAIAQAVALDPTNAQVLYLQGLHQRHVGDTSASLDTLSQAAVLDPANPAIAAELGNGYRAVNDLQHAEYWLKQAVLISSNNPKFQQMLALFYADEAPNLTGEGIQALEGAADKSTDPEVMSAYGWALYSLGRQDEGRAKIEDALKAAPDDPRVLYDKARVLLGDNQTADALALLNRVAKSDSPLAADARSLIARSGG